MSSSVVTDVDAPAAGSFKIRMVMAFFAIYFLWGTTFLAIRIAVQEMPPLFAAGVRFFVAGVLLYGVMRLRGHSGPTACQWRSLAMIGLLMLWRAFLVRKVWVAVALGYFVAGEAVTLRTLIDSVLDRERISDSAKRESCDLTSDALKWNGSQYECDEFALPVRRSFSEQPTDVTPYRLKRDAKIDGDFLRTAPLYQ